MANFGFSRLRVVNPYEPAFREAKSAVGAAGLLANAEDYESVAEAVGDCTLVVGTTSARDRGLRQALKPLQVGARVIRKHLATGRVALLFGSEKRGLSNQDLSHCHWIIRIPTGDQVPSMNLGQAVAVCLYEIGKVSVGPQRTAKSRPASAQELERMTLLWLDLMIASGYTAQGSESKAEQKVRRMVRDLALSPKDVETWLGILRQIQWKLSHP